ALQVDVAIRLGDRDRQPRRALGPRVLDPDAGESALAQRLDLHALEQPLGRVDARARLRLRLAIRDRRDAQELGVVVQPFARHYALGDEAAAGDLRLRLAELVGGPVPD